jgi:hypothetical protein
MAIGPAAVPFAATLLAFPFFSRHVALRRARFCDRALPQSPDAGAGWLLGVVIFFFS